MKFNREDGTCPNCLKGKLVEVGGGLGCLACEEKFCVVHHDGNEILCREVDRPSLYFTLELRDLIKKHGNVLSMTQVVGGLEMTKTKIMFDKYVNDTGGFIQIQPE